MNNDNNSTRAYNPDLIAAVYKLTSKLGDPHMADSPYVKGGCILKPDWLRDMGITATSIERELGRAKYETGSLYRSYLPMDVLKNIYNYFFSGTERNT